MDKETHSPLHDIRYVTYIEEENRIVILLSLPQLFHAIGEFGILYIPFEDLDGETKHIHISCDDRDAEKLQKHMLKGGGVSFHVTRDGLYDMLRSKTARVAYTFSEKGKEVILSLEDCTERMSKAFFLPSHQNLH